MTSSHLLRSVLKLLGCVLLSITCKSSIAQTISNTELRLTASTIQDGGAGIGDTAVFEFTFSRDLPFSSQANVGFHFEPRRLNFRKEYFFPGGRKARFTIVHQPNTDYIVYAFGVATCAQKIYYKVDENGDFVLNDKGEKQPIGEAFQSGCFHDTFPPDTYYLQKRPHVINYTTAAEAGTRDVSGQVTFGDVSQPPAKASRAALLRDLIAQAYSDVMQVAAPMLLSGDATAASDSLARTVVFLLDGSLVYDQNNSGWTPRAGAAPNAAGAFAMNHVRDGVYWPVAIHFADRFGQIVGRYGYHDANGDFEPDSVVVSGGDVSGLKIVLMQDEPILARAAEPTTRRRAQRVFSDAELLTVTALDPQPDGTASTWRYTFYSPAHDSLVTVDAGSFNTQVYVEEADPDAGTQLTLSQAFVNSDQILQMAESRGGADFRSSYPSGTASITVELGDLPLEFRPIAPSRFWHVLYESPPGVEPERRLVFFFDAETAQQLPGQPVASEGLERAPLLTLSLPVPHPIRDEAKVTFSLDQAGPVRLAVYDVLGRRVMLLAEGVQPAGTQTRTWNTESLATGTYLLRLEAGGHAVQQAVVVVR